LLTNTDYCPRFFSRKNYFDRSLSIINHPRKKHLSVLVKNRWTHNEADNTKDTTNIDPSQHLHHIPWTRSQRRHQITINTRHVWRLTNSCERAYSFVYNVKIVFAMTMLRKIIYYTRTVEYLPKIHLSRNNMYYLTNMDRPIALLIT